VNATALACIASILLVGCSKEKPSAGSHGENRTGVSPAPGAVLSAAITTWDGELGNVVATPSLERSSPLLFTRDSVPTAAREVELFSHDARTAHALMQVGSTTKGCERNAVLMVAPGAPPPVWSLALAPNTATPIEIDAIGELAPRDSAALIVSINRLISALPEDSAAAVFHGLPIVVRDAWRLVLPDSTPVVVAIAARSLNTESNPRGQLFTVIVEPDPSGGIGGWRTAWSRSESGPEDRLEGADLLAAISLRSGRAVLVLQRESDAGQALDFVDRTGPGVWRLRWTTSALSCTLLSR